MKRLLPATILLLLVAALLAEVVLRDSGYVLVAWGDWALETTVWVAAIAALSGAWLLRILILLLVGLWRSPRDFPQWWRGLFSRRHIRLTRRGLRAYLEADWRRAARDLKKGAPASGDPEINYLFAARARQRMGDLPGAETLLRLAEQQSSDHSLSVGLMRASMLAEMGQHERAVAHLQALRQRDGEQESILRSLLRSYRELQDWKHIEGLLPILRKRKLLTADELHRLEFDVYAGLLALRQRSGVTDEYVLKVGEVWKNLPDRVQRNPDVVAVYARALLAAGAAPEAERVLAQALHRGYSPLLVNLYGRATGNDVQKQLEHAESWLKEFPDDATLLLCLGRICLMNRQWGRARDYFQGSLARESRPETCAELARLLAHLGEHEASTQYYEKGLQVSIEALPNLPQPRVQGGS